MHKAGLLLLLSVAIVHSGCRTVAPVQGSKESSVEAQEALTAVAGALSGRPLSEEELRGLEQQIRTDEEAQTAVQAITGSIEGKARQVKYCPVTGRRFAVHLEMCPEHQIPLETVD